MAGGYRVKWWNNQTPDYPELKKEDRPSWKLLAGEENAGENDLGRPVRTFIRLPSATSTTDPASSPHLCSSFDEMSEFPLPLRIAALACAC